MGKIVGISKFGQEVELLIKVISLYVVHVISLQMRWSQGELLPSHRLFV